MKKLLLSLLVFLIVLPFQAQSDDFRLSVNKSVGYNNGSMIRGAFKLSIIGPEEQIASVTYQIDGQEMAVVSSAPFELRFNTGDYAVGEHVLSAVVSTTGAETFSTAGRTFRFISAEEESADMKNLMLPMLGLVGALVIAMILSQTVLLRNRKPLELVPGAPRHYGFKGGTICPRCKRPFSLHWWGINLGVGVYDRCDFCGKRGVYRSKSRAELAAAEAAEVTNLQPQAPVVEKSEEEKLREMLDNSKYTHS